MALLGPFSGGEKENLKAALERHREVVLWKLEGLSDEQLRRRVTPSGATVLGIVKHLANLEYLWFCATFDRPSSAMPSGDPNETTAEILTLYGRARAAADEVIDDVYLDARGHSPDGAEVTLRSVLIHVVEAVARHAGRLDIIRELIDGQTGEHRR